MPAPKPRARRWAAHSVSGFFLVLVTLSALASPPSPTPDPREPMPAPDASPAVERLLETPYFTDDERSDARIFHGRYAPEDLNTPARTARAALTRAVYDDPSFAAADTDPLDAADALLARGEPAAALKRTGTLSTPRAARIRAAALELLGRTDDALKEGQSAIDALVARTIDDPGEIVEGVRLLAQRVRLAGPPSGTKAEQSAAEFKGMMASLGAAREGLNKLHWPSLLAEAELLSEKNNPKDAGEALEQTLTLNPTCAEAWALLGRMAVDGFDVDRAEQIALRLEALAADEPGGFPTVSTHAAAIRARAALRQIAGQTALDALAPALARSPTDPELLSLQAAAEAVRFDLARADILLAAFDARFPASPLAVFEVGKYLADARQYAPAAKYLNEASRRAPHWAAPLIELGLVQVQAAKDDEALDALERAFALDPFNIRADNSLRLVRELTTYSRLESEHFIVRFKPGVDEVLAKDMLPILERNHAIVTASPATQPGGIDHVVPAKTFIDLMPDHEWFAVRIAGMPQIHTIAASTGPLIAMEAPRDGPKHNGTYDWARVIRHEYVHTVTLDRTNNRIPHWFTEAAAVYLELAPRDFSTCQILARALDTGTLFDFDQINLAFIRPKKPTDRAQAYAQGHWMYDFLIQRFGPRAPLDLMDQYAAGVREEEAYQSVLKLSRADFFTQFSAWAKAEVVSWGMALTPGTPSVRDLLLEAALADPKRGPSLKSQLERLAQTLALSAGGLGAPDPDDAPELDLQLPPPTPDLITRLLEAHPGHPDLLELALDTALESTNNRATPELVPLLERYAAARPVDPKPHRLLAQMELGANPDQDPARAIPHLEFLDAREQRTPVFASELAKRYYALGDPTTATLKAERATQIAPYAAPPRELAATIAIQNNDLQTAERHIRALITLEPDRPLHKQRLEALRRRTPASTK